MTEGFLDFVPSTECCYVLCVRARPPPPDHMSETKQARVLVYYSPYLPTDWCGEGGNGGVSGTKRAWQAGRQDLRKEGEYLWESKT